MKLRLHIEHVIIAIPSTHQTLPNSYKYGWWYIQCYVV